MDGSDALNRLIAEKFDGKWVRMFEVLHAWAVERREGGDTQGENMYSSCEGANHVLVLSNAGQWRKGWTLLVKECFSSSTNGHTTKRSADGWASPAKKTVE